MVRASCLPIVLLTLSIRGGLACGPGSLTGSRYRNFLLEVSSTTPCGEVGGAPQGVCALAATCAMMGGEALEHRYNCPLTRATCCRPVASCDATSVALNLLWQSADYGQASPLHPSSCELTVMPSADTCYIRIDFDDMDIESTKVDQCEVSSLVIKNQEQGDGAPICGTLNHKTTFVKVGTNLVGLPVPITLSLQMNHLPHKYSARINHIKCNEIVKFNFRKYRTIDEIEGREDSERDGRLRSRDGHKEPAYMARLFAVAYTDKPLIRSCPVAFLTKDIVVGAASCSLRLGGPGTSKGLMVVHGASHEGPASSLPSTVSQMAKYVAANGVVVKATTFHPMYNHITHENDIALYFLNKTVYTAEPVEMPSPHENDYVELAVHIARYHHHERAEDLTVLAGAEEKLTRVLGNHRCSGAGPAVANVTSNNTLCLDGVPKEHSPCKGEPGSPVIHIGSTGTITLVGLTMGGYRECGVTKSSEPEPALKLINYLDFINVATSPSYKIQPAEPSTSALAPVVQWFSSLWPNSEGNARDAGEEDYFETE